MSVVIYPVPPITPPPTTTPAPAPPPTTTPLPPPQQPPGVTDELGSCCTNITAALDALVEAVQAFPPPDPTCCTNLTTQINAVAVQIQTIAATLQSMASTSGSSAAPVDLTPVTTALTALQSQLASLQADNDVNAGTLNTAIASIATAIAGISPQNLQSIVDAINSLFTTLDVPQAVYDQLSTDGWLSSTYAQLAAPGALGSGIVATIATWAHQFYRWLVLSSIGVDVDAPPGSAPAASTAETLLDGTLSTFLKSADVVITPIVQDIIDTIANTLMPVGVTSPGSIGVNPNTPVAQIMGVTFAAHLAGYVVNWLGIHDSEALAKWVERIGAVLGFEELREVNLGPLIRHGIAKVADNQAKAIFRQELPSAGSAAQWLARGLIDDPTADTLLGFAGMDASYQDAAKQAAQRGLQPFILIRLLTTGLFSTADLTDEMTFAGIRPTTQSRIQLAAPYMATDAARKQLISALDEAYTEGLYADSDYQSLVASAEQNTTLSSLELTTVQVKALVKQTKELAQSYAILYQGGLMDVPTLQSSLEGIGLQPNWVTAFMAVQEARSEAKTNRQALAAMTRLTNQTNTIIRKTALQNYLAGTIDLAAYVAALVGTGLTAVQAAAWGDLAALRIAGGLTWVYGLSLPKQQASILSKQVEAILAQLSAVLIDDTSAVSQLQALGLSNTWINALIAKTDAQATAKSLATLYPVQP